MDTSVKGTKENKWKIVNARVSKEQYEKLKILSEKAQLSVSEIIRTAVNKYLK